MSGIAFFDFDGTICRGDSFLAFIRFAKGRGAYRRGILWLSPWIVLYFLRLYPNWRLKERFFSHFFKGAEEAALMAIGEAFSATVLPQMCRPDMLERIRWHQSQGHEVVVLTASSAIWLGGWCRRQKAQLTGTAFQVKDGCYTGKLEGFNCHGLRKKDLVAAKLAGGAYANNTYGYGNSRSDAAFLKLVAHPQRMR